MRYSRPRVMILGMNYDPESTGIAPYTTGMARGLARDGGVQVLTTHPHYPTWKVAEGFGGWRSRSADEGVDVIRLAHFLPSNPSGLGRILSEVSFAARGLMARKGRPKVVVVVSPGLLPVLTARLLARVWRVPLIVVVQDIYSSAVAELELLGGRLDSAALSLESYLLRSADHVVTIHERMKQTLQKKLRVDPSQVTVIPNWTHVSRPSCDRVAERRAMGWKAQETVVLHAGNMGAKQGLDHVVDAARLAELRQLPIRFVLMGVGARREFLIKAASALNTLDVIEAVDSARFSDVLAAADALLLHERPGVEEMCVPSKLTSYFASGRPVICATSATGAAADEVAASGSGVIVPAGQPEKMLAAVESLRLLDLDAMGRRGQHYAETALSQERALDAYRNIVSSAIATGARRRIRS